MRRPSAPGPGLLCLPTPSGPQVLKGVAHAAGGVSRPRRRAARRVAWTWLATRGLTPLVGREQEWAAPGALGAGAGRRWAGGAAQRRGGHWQIAPGGGADASRWPTRAGRPAERSAVRPITAQCPVSGDRASAAGAALGARTTRLRHEAGQAGAGAGARHGLPLAETVPLLAALLSLPLPAHYPPLHADARSGSGRRPCEALLAWLLAERQRQPVLAVIGRPALGRSLDAGVAQPAARPGAHGAHAHAADLPPGVPPAVGRRSHLTQLTLTA